MCFSLFLTPHPVLLVHLAMPSRVVLLLLLMAKIAFRIFDAGRGLETGIQLGMALFLWYLDACSMVVFILGECLKSDVVTA